MTSSFDQFARVGALRPAMKRARLASVVTGEGSRSPQRAGEPALAAVLGGACERNHFGEHLVVRRWYAQPEPCPPLNGALELLDPRAPRLAADPARWLFLDTETTGLAGGTGTYAFLVGLAWWDGAGLQVEQFFLRDYDDEHSMLTALSARLAERPVLVTFNGKSFDWPLLETRYRMTRCLRLPEPAAHLDLLHPARHLWRLRLGSVRLSELERSVLGAPSSLADWDRAHDVRSEMIPHLYFDFLHGGSPVPLLDVFRHNQMDLRGLAAVAVKMAALLDDPEAAEAAALDLYGIARLVRRRSRPQQAAARSRRLCERALASGLPAAVDRAARRELAALAKRERDFARACALWEELIGTTAPSCHPERSEGSALPAHGKKPGADSSSRFARLGMTSGDASCSHQNPHQPDSSAGPTLDAIEACVELAIHYEHRARQPARALEFARQALAALGRARGAGLLSPEKHARLHIRFERRVNRLEAKVRAALPLAGRSPRVELPAASPSNAVQKAGAG